MFHGTTIDELLEIVERAEDHAHTMVMKSDSSETVLYPGFLAELMKVNQDFVGAI